MPEVLTNTTAEKLENLDPKKFIIIKGARVNNLKNVNIAIPRNRLIVVTGLSGSGKSSLAFDTLFAEGQRMYVESLSAYARQFLGRMEKPDVDYIRGVAPAIAIQQKVNTRNPRSTVGTTTEIYDYLKLLFARIGITYSPVSGEPVTRDTVSDVVNFILGKPSSTKFMILCPLYRNEQRNIQEELNILLQKGFTRIQADHEIKFIEDILAGKQEIENPEDINILIDRASVRTEDEDFQFRIEDSVQTAFFEGQDTCYIDIVDPEGITRHTFSDKFEKDGMVFEEPGINFFSFNNPYGACRTCEGFGRILGIDEDLVIPDKSLSVYEGAIAPWRGPTMQKWLKPLIAHAMDFDFPIHRSYRDLDEAQRKLLWEGNRYFKGLNAFFKHLESKTHKIQYRVMLSRYRGRTTCPDCQGTRLRKDATYVKINNRSITELVLWPIEKMSQYFDQLELDEYQEKVADRITKEIKNRLSYLQKVGLGYLTLNRLTSSLSGGEYQRIKLATSLGSALVGSMYILDEPSIGLHPRDTQRLIEVLQTLRDLGNTVIVVEHEEEIMYAADQLIDLGPDAGSHGGHLVFQGNIKSITNGQAPESHTTRFLKGEDIIPLPGNRRPWAQSIQILGARENNLKNIDVDIPLRVLTCITGVSGSGKSTLVKNILHPAIGKILGTVNEATGKFDKLEGDYEEINKIEFVDQNPIGKSSRSNPVTYVKAFDPIRQLMAEQPVARQRGYKPAYFSFNVEGGRCETCQGEGIIKIEMQFMADVELTCESCGGKRYKQEVLEITYKGKNIADILEMTIDDSMEFFREHATIINKLKPLQDTGLGYLRLGQSSNSLSGGEAQRVKLSSFLGKRGHAGKNNGQENILFIFDEPTTGLHYHDINKLLNAVNALVEQGNTVVIIEHNMEVIKSADWVIDLGPEGGDKGGTITFAGTPEDLIKKSKSYTAKYLKEKFK